MATFRDLRWRLVERIATLLSLVLTQTVLLRELGAISYGALSYALALVALVSPVAKFGCGGIVTKALLLHPGNADQLLGSALTWRLIGGAVSVVLSMALLLTYPTDVRFEWVVLLAACQALTVYTVLEFHFDARAESHAIAPYRLALTLSFVLFKIAAAVNGATVDVLVLVYAFELIAGSLLVAWRHRTWLHGSIHPKFDRAEFRWLARSAPWVLLAGLAEVIYLKIDVVMLSSMVGLSDAGVYSAAARVSEATYLLPALLMASVFPVWWRARNNPAKWTRRIRDFLSLLAFLGILTALILSVAVAPLITTLFGDEYTRAGEVLVVHAWAAPFVFMRAALSRWLIAEDLLRHSLWTTALGAISNVGLNLVLIPLHGIMGAAIATLVSYAVAAWLSLYLFETTRGFAQVMGRSLVAGLDPRNQLWFWRWLRVRTDGAISRGQRC